jgi:hypothetical protein
MPVQPIILTKARRFFQYSAERTSVSCKILCGIKTIPIETHTRLPTASPIGNVLLIFIIDALATTKA